MTSGYRLYEADIRVAHSWMYLAENKLQDAQIQAERAKKMSQEMGYHWGQVDADEVLEILKTRSVTTG